MNPFKLLECDACDGSALVECWESRSRSDAELVALGRFPSGRPAAHRSRIAAVDRRDRNFDRLKGKRASGRLGSAIS